MPIYGDLACASQFRRKMDLLTEHRLPGVRLPPDGAFLPSYSCTAMPEPHCGPETSVNQEQKEQSYDHSHRENSIHHFRWQGTMKSTHNAITKTARLNPLKRRKRPQKKWSHC